MNALGRRLAAHVLAGAFPVAGPLLLGVAWCWCVPALVVAEESAGDDAPVGGGEVVDIDEAADAMPLEDQQDFQVEVFPADVLQRPRPAGGLFGAGLRAIFDLVAPPPPPPPLAPLPIDEAEDGEMPNDPRAAQIWQQRKQIRQQARHMEQLFQPALRSELEMVRQACGSLPPEARKQVLAAGRAAVAKTALEFATVQMQGGPARRTFDARRGIQEPLARAVEPHVPAAEFAAYQREQTLRAERRAKAARVAIVAKLDGQLDLKEDQRRAIEADLERRWDESWVRELDDQGMIVNNYRSAPDYADACIAPHLDAAQAEEWKRWRLAAGVAVVGSVQTGWNLDGQGLHQEDDWWTK